MKAFFKKIRIEINGILNKWMYAYYCKKADNISNMHQGLRVYILPRENNKLGLKLLTSTQIAAYNQKCAKKERIDINRLLKGCYAYADQNTSAYQTFVKKKKRKIDRKRSK